MNYDDQPQPATTGVDDRLSLMSEFVDLEAKHKHLDREQKRLAEQGHKVHARMTEVRNQLADILGFDRGMTAAKDAAKRLAEIERKSRG